MFNFPVHELPPQERNAPADFPSIWKQKPREGHAAALGRQQHQGRGAQQERGFRHRHDAADARHGEHRAHRGLAGRTRAARSIRIRSMQTLAQRGGAVYRQYCADCHGASGRDFAGANVGKVTPIDEIGTDRHRLDSYTLRPGGQPVDALRRATRGASSISARRSATPTCRSTAYGCAGRTCTTARCPNVRALLEPSQARPRRVLARQRRVSTAGTSASSATSRARATSATSVRHQPPRQFQHRPRRRRLWHGAAARRQGRAGRVSQDLLGAPS